MAPPCFSDLGKQARDIFSKNYHIGLIKLECKTKTNTGVHFTVNGTSNNDTGRVNAFLETKYCIAKHGITIKEKWNTENVMATELSVDEPFVKGVHVSLDTNFAPQTGKKSGTLSAAFDHEHARLDAELELLSAAAPKAHAAAVFGYQHWLAGAKLTHDLGKNQIAKSHVGLGYSLGDFVVHASVVDGSEFGGCFYQKVNSQLETGMTLSWAAGTNETKFGLGCAYKVDDDTSIRAKVSNSSQIGLSFSHRLRPGVRLTLSALLDGKSFNQGGHKVGLGLEMEG